MKKVIGIGAVIAVVVVVIIFLAHRDGDNRASEASHQVTAEEDDAHGEVGPQVMATQSRRTSALSNILNSSSSKEFALSQLVPEAERGRALYVLAVGEVVDACGLLYMPAEHGIDRVVPLVVRSDGMWKRRYAEHAKFCGERTNLDARAEKLVANLQVRMNTLANQGDRIGQMYDAMADTGGRLSDSNAGIALDILQDARADGESVRRAAHALVSSESESIRRLDKELFGAAYSPDGKENIKSMAAQSYACSRGVYCGPSGHFQRTSCLLTGACDVFLPLNDYVRKYRLSGSDYALMQQYAQRLAALVGDSR